MRAGRLLEASDVLHALEAEAKAPPRGLDWNDKRALTRAPQLSKEVDARIPVIVFVPADDYADLEIVVGGRALDDPERGRRLPPDESIEISISAKGHRTKTDKVVLSEGERRKYRFSLEPEAPRVVPKPKPKIPAFWLGVRFDGYLVPQPVMNLFWDGGTTTGFPGGGLAFTARTRDADVVIGLSYLRFMVPETPFLPLGAPETDWEIASLDGHALTLGLDLLFRFPLDKEERGVFRLGGSVGLGVMLDGALRRVQAVPATQPDGSVALVKCAGPNDPAGSFRYCNQLDKDAAHYGDYQEPSLFSGGLYPLLFPLATLPMMGFSYRFSPAFAADLDVGLSLAGLRGTLGLRFGL